MKYSAICLIALVSSGLVSSIAAAQTPIVNEGFKLLASDGGGGQQFGMSVSISGNVAIVGANYDDDNGTTSGSAYIFRFDGSVWNEEAKLIASDGAAGDNFGVSVSISGYTAIVGSPYDDDVGDFSGSVYIYRFNGSTWNEEAKLHASDGANNDYFGYAVSLSGDTALVGSYGNSDSGPFTGSAYVFRYNGGGWNEEAKLLAVDGATLGYFSCSVSISGDISIVGAFNDNGTGPSSGSAYVFRFVGGKWIQESKLVASDGAWGDEYGFSVAVSGNRVVVGARADDDNGGQSGSAYVYRFNGSTWFEEAKLLASNGVASDYFGVSVAISGETTAIGVYQGDGNVANCGTAYVYRFNGSTWIEEVELLASDGAVSDFFGYSISVSDDTVVVGAFRDESTAGSAYLFAPFDSDGDGVPNEEDNCELYNPDQADCNNNGIGDICDIANSTSDDVNGNGVPDECECLGDMNNDGVVNITDLLLLIGGWGACP